ncbi:Holliday junction ATP-dependent DNA helicase ruvA [Desulfurobacterium thermolithotrophum DSM 11699]|uniref:Holliday junction branch migration complex subunit RuvA n=1 Tax=Desulfurobacterium thermolithotrophum (strain DSM 11699 / BSA) TaxID=868864 RepID=F0S1G5_DESTD|nr:Holliday junction branch migration protein RuvA [Desulfurobacterium thermolithotrophum]ADY73968.1 Holliday junction ATP-dependent DNA helicase ruvA [Desulfurobacterium thermolithotrophum DSM 11699]
MIDYLKGKVIFKYSDSISLLCGSIAFRVFVPLNLLTEIREGDKVALFVKFTLPSEGTPSLYGFKTREERVFFEELLKIPKVGSKVAMSVISHFSLDELRNIVSTKDVKTLSTVPGLGKKLSERVILELKDKPIFGEERNIPSELLEILTALSYSRKEVVKAVEGIDLKDRSIEELVKEVVKKLSGRKF